MLINIKEIFTSIQGEGPLVGYEQLFVRFCNCNLKCEYCDTEFAVNESKKYTVEQLVEIVNKNKFCHSVSLTGGEPLLSKDFLKEFLPLCDLPVYLETNATLYENLKEIINYIDYVSADIKLPSTTGLKPLWSVHDKFFETAKQKNLFAKIVFDKNITEDEIGKCCELGRKYNIELILQPKMNGNEISVDNIFIEQIFGKFLEKYHNVRVIPQVHKFLNVI